jgi:hypothetical protein
MVGAGAEPHEPGFGWVARFLVTNHRESLIRQVFGKVVAIFRAVGLLYELVIFDEVGIPVIGLAAEEAIESVEALREGPFAPSSTRSDIFFGDIVVLAKPVRAVTIVLLDLTDGRALCG